MTGTNQEPASDGLERIDLAARQWSEVDPSIDTRLFQLVGSVLLLSQQIESDFRSMTRGIDVDLGPGELRILLMLRRTGPDNALRGVDMLDRLLITSGAITKQLSKLEAKQLVVRTRSSQMRGRLIQLTDAGKAIADHVIELGDAGFPLLSRAFNCLDTDQQRQALEIVRQLLGKVEEFREEARE